MKNITYITTALLLILTNAGIGVAQEYREALQPVYVGTSNSIFNEDVSVTDLHGYLIEKEVFLFRNEIKKAQKHRATVMLNNIPNLEEVSTEDYLRTLRKIGNRSDNLVEFTQLLSEELSLNLVTLQASEQLEELYKVIRQNTFYGQLDIAGAELTWL